MMTKNASSPPRVSAVVFDIFGTLAPLEPLSSRLESAGLPKQSLKLWFARMLRDAFALEAAGTYKSFREVAAGSLEVLLVENERRVDADAIDRVLEGFSQLELRPEVASAFESLERAGISVATLGNGSASVVRQLLERAGLTKRVKRVISIEEVKHWKPHREPYLHASQVLGIEPANLALVAAHAWDCQGARQAGLISVWVSYLERHYPPSMPAPDVTASNLGEAVSKLIEHPRTAHEL